jgi:hypothetical protein
MATSVLTYSKSRLTKGVYLKYRYCEPAFEGEVAWSRSRLVDIINRDNERAPEITCARHHEPHVFYISPGIYDDKLITMEKLPDAEDSDTPAQHGKEGPRVTFGLKVTLWFTEHVYYQYARGGHGKSYQYKVPPNTREFTEVAEDEFFETMDHTRTGATYVRGTEELVLWTNYNRQGTFEYIGRAPDSIATHSVKQGTADHHTLYSKGYYTSQELSSEQKEYLHYSTSSTTHNGYLSTFIEYPLPTDPTITAYIVNGGILKNVGEEVPEVMVVPAPVRPPPEVISLLEDDSEGSAVEVRVNIPVDTSVYSDSDDVPIMNVSTSNWRKRKIIQEDSSIDE